MILKLIPNPPLRFHFALYFCCVISSASTFTRETLRARSKITTHFLLGPLRQLLVDRPPVCASGKPFVLPPRSAANSGGAKERAIIFERALSNQSKSICGLLLHEKFGGKIVSDLTKKGFHAVLSSKKIFRVLPNMKPISTLAKHLKKKKEIVWFQECPTYRLFEISGSARPARQPDGTENGTALVGFPSAWKSGFTGVGEHIGLADTGVDTGVINTLAKDLKSVATGVGYARKDKSWGDFRGHGTHLAGSIISDGHSNQGKLLGGAFGAQLHVQSIYDENGDLVLQPSQLFAAAYKNGVRIHSNSWGSLHRSYDITAAEIDDFVWEHPDFLVVVAAGNLGEDADRDGIVDEYSIPSPATAKNVLTVGASENVVVNDGLQLTLGQFSPQAFPVPPLSNDKFSDNAQGIAGFSSRGPAADGRRKPDLVAPGTNILGLRSQLAPNEKLWGDFNGQLVYSAGTSSSAPLVAAAAALVRQFVRKKMGGSHSPSAALIKALLLHGAQDLFPGQFGLGPHQEIPSRRPNNVEGFGRLNITQILTTKYELLIDDTKGVAHGESVKIPLEVSKSPPGEFLILTLNYTDAPAIPGALNTLVNDLDLLVTLPSGVTFASKDRINNQEYIEFPLESDGPYLVQIRGYRVAKSRRGRQPFALIATRVVRNL